MFLKRVINADPRMSRARTVVRAHIAHAAIYKYFWTFIVMKGKCLTNCTGFVEILDDRSSRDWLIEVVPGTNTRYDETSTDEYLETISLLFFLSSRKIARKGTEARAVKADG